jgi:hypothetical protein
VSLTSRSSDNIFSFRESSRTFPLYLTKSSGHQAEFRTVGDVSVARSTTRTWVVDTRKVSSEFWFLDGLQIRAKSGIPWGVFRLSKWLTVDSSLVVFVFVFSYSDTMCLWARQLSRNFYHVGRLPSAGNFEPALPLTFSHIFSYRSHEFPTFSF